MGELAEVLEGVVGLIGGGIILLLISNELGRIEPINLSFWGIGYIVVGVAILSIVVVTVFSARIGGKR